MSVRVLCYVLIAIAVVILTGVGYSYLLVQWWGFWPDAAAFGDSFGALSCIFSALGFIAVLVALSMQYRQINEGALQTRVTVQLQLLLAYLLSDAVAPADKAQLGRVLEAAVNKISPDLLAGLDKDKKNG